MEDIVIAIHIKVQEIKIVAVEIGMKLIKDKISELIYYTEEEMDDSDKSGGL